MKKFLVFCALSFLIPSALGQTNDERANTPVPFTLADRDRLIQLEVEMRAMNDKVESLDDKIDYLDDKIDYTASSLRREIDSIRSLMYIMIAGIFGLIGFIIWDGRTFHLKLEKRVDALEKRHGFYRS